MRGFQQYGFNWNGMVKDPEFHFDDRTAGQVRDRFRLKHKDLYAQPAVARGPLRQPATGARSRRSQNPSKRKSKPASASSFTSKPAQIQASESTVQASTIPDDMGSCYMGHASAPSESLSWEDMAIRPVFSFD